MGWSVMCDPSYNKKRLIELLVSESDWKGSSFKPVRHSVVGEHVWILLERVEGEGPRNEVALYMVQGPLPDETGGWGWKGLPCREHLDCPAYMLDADLCPDYYGEWKEQVREERKQARELARRVDRLEPGEVLSLHGRSYELEKRTRGGWIVLDVSQEGGGERYKMSLAQAREAVELAQEAPTVPAAAVDGPAQGALL